MADRSTDAWYPTAAYLYVLHLDGPALAWEYLRRNPDYRRDWVPSFSSVLRETPALLAQVSCS